MRPLELDGLTRSFGEVTVLDGVSLDVAAGEHLALLGPSGSGKSTLLRLVAGLDDPDAGDIRLGGESLLGLPPHRRDIALVFQQYALYPHLSVLRNVTTGLRHGQGMPRADAERRAAEVLELVGLGEFGARKPAQLSGGQRQRVALARALARRAGLVLLDEPLSGLDAQLRMHLRAEISLGLRRTGATVVHVTHDQADAMAGADRIAILDGGRLRQIGEPEELYREPVDLFVARFLGTPGINVISLESEGDGLRSPFGVHRAETAGASWFGIRPEHLRVESGGAWSTEAIVSGAELVGADYIVTLDVEGAVWAARSSSRPPAPRTRVRVSTDPEHIHVFDDDERRMAGDARRLEFAAWEGAA